MQFTEMQKAAVLTALEKAVKSAKSEARKGADEEARQLYESFGTDRVKVKLGDAEIGTVTLEFSKDAYQVTDREAFLEFMLANGLAREKRSIKPEYMAEAVARIAEDMPDAIATEVALSADAGKYLAPKGDAFVLEGTAEPVPGIVPAPKEVTGTRMTGCKPEVVLPALNALPSSMAELLLGGGADE